MRHAVDCYPRGCPCGYFSDPTRECTCSAGTIARYQERISGPLLDHIDIHFEVPRVEYEKLTDRREGERSSDVRARSRSCGRRCSDCSFRRGRSTVSSSSPAPSPTWRAPSRSGRRTWPRPSSTEHGWGPRGEARRSHSTPSGPPARLTRYSHARVTVIRVTSGTRRSPEWEWNPSHSSGSR
jgi:Magnesium chelatase, subunit ChlI